MKDTEHVKDEEHEEIYKENKLVLLLDNDGTITRNVGQTCVNKLSDIGCVELFSRQLSFEEAKEIYTKNIKAADEITGGFRDNVIRFLKKLIQMEEDVDVIIISNNNKNLIKLILTDSRKKTKCLTEKEVEKVTIIDQFDTNFFSKKISYINKKIAPKYKNSTFFYVDDNKSEIRAARSTKDKVYKENKNKLKTFHQELFDRSWAKENSVQSLIDNLSIDNNTNTNMLFHNQKNKLAVSEFSCACNLH